MTVGELRAAVEGPAADRERRRRLAETAREYVDGPARDGFWMPSTRRC